MDFNNDVIDLALGVRWVGPREECAGEEASSPLVSFKGSTIYKIPCGESSSGWSCMLVCPPEFSMSGAQELKSLKALVGRVQALQGWEQFKPLTAPSCVPVSDAISLVQAALLKIAYKRLEAWGYSVEVPSCLDGLGLMGYEACWAKAYQKGQLIMLPLNYIDEVQLTPLSCTASLDFGTDMDIPVILDQLKQCWQGRRVAYGGNSKTLKEQLVQDLALVVHRLRTRWVQSRLGLTNSVSGL